MAYAQEKTPVVAIVLKQNSIMHETAVYEITSKSTSQSKSKIHFKYIYNNSQNNNTSLNLLDVDYIISVGVESAITVLRSNTTLPILFTLVPKKTLTSLIRRYATVNRQPNYYSIYLTQPLIRKLLLSKIILPDSGRVGLLLARSDNDIDSYTYTQAAKANIYLSVKYLDEYNKPIDAIKASLNDSDIYIAQYDEALLSRHNAKWLLYMAYKLNKPVIGYSASFSKAGAVASIYSTPKQIGLQSAEWLIDILSNRKVDRISFPKYFTVSVNKKIQRILRLNGISQKHAEMQLRDLEGELYDN